MATREEQKQVREQKQEAVMTQREYSNMLLSRYMENLPSNLENKKERLTAEIQAYVANRPDKKHIPAAIIMQMLGRDFSRMTKEPIYSAIELSMVFEYYQDFIAELNMSGIKFPPSKQNFCMFAGITSGTYAAYLTHQDVDKRTVTQKIEDYINEVNWTAAQNDEQNAYTVEKRTRLKGIGGGYSEAKEDTNINITSQVKSPSNMQELIDNLKAQGLLIDGKNN
jgi:hypothetical protein